MPTLVNPARGLISLLAIGWAMLATPSSAQIVKQVLQVHSPSIEGNLQGNSAERDVVVLLPERYATDSSRRYPVLILLHGFGDHAASFSQYAGIAEAMSEAEAEFIVVVPDGDSKFGGSLYANSPTTGNYEGFITGDLIDYIDSNYRTLPRREARGIAGHSMGGCGALKLGMKHADVFSSIYAMSPTCMTIPKDVPERLAIASSLSEEEVADAPGRIRAMFALASAWSPAPDKPPFYLEWPQFDGEELSPAHAQWVANLPLTMVPQYTDALASMRAIALDVGDEDSGLADVQKMDRQLTRFAIPHATHIYQGDHVSRVPARMKENVLPFFSQYLESE